MLKAVTALSCRPKVTEETPVSREAAAARVSDFLEKARRGGAPAAGTAG
jgi:hypothetical protein